MTDPYRSLPETHWVLDVVCRRCGTHGLPYAYYPYVKPIPGPLCQKCFIEWRGQITWMKYAVVGVRNFCAYHRHPNYGGDLPLKEFVSPPRHTIPSIQVPGKHPDISPYVDP
jgi:hypothetical protein